VSEPFNRKVRRDIKNAKLTPQDLQMYIDEACGETAKKVVYDYSYVVAMMLRDRLHFGHKRTEWFMKEMLDLWDSIDRGYTTIPDIAQCLKEEIDFEVIWKD